jgi:hypothetical protein
MRKAKQQRWLGRCTLAVVVAFTIALVLVLSIAITSGAGHDFHQFALASPVFFVFFFLATSLGDWLHFEDFFIETKPRFSASPTRAPPA